MKTRCFIAGGLLLLAVGIFSGCASRSYDTAATKEFSEEELNTEPDVIEKNGLAVTVELGYEKFVKNGRYANAMVTVENTEKDFEGLLCIAFPSGMPQNVAYKQEISVPEKESRKYEMPVLMNSGGDEIEVLLKDEKDVTILSKKIKINLIYNTDVAYVGVLTDDPSRYDAFVGNKVKLFFLTLEEFPQNERSLDELDAILVDGIDTGALKDEQKKALDGFAKKASVIQAEKDWTADNLEEQISSHLSQFSRMRIEKETYGSSSDYTAYSSVEVKDPQKIPGILPYVVVLVCYLLFIGPPLYFILKKIDKPGALWAIVPLLSIVFTLVIYGMGSKTRLVKPYIGYLEILDVGEQQADQQVLFTLASPYNTGYEITLPKEYAVAAMNGGSGYMTNGYLSRQLSGNQEGNYSTSIYFGEAGTTIDVIDNAAFASGYYKAQKPMDVDMEFSGTVHMSLDYKVTGSVSNTTGQNLTNASLCVGDVYIQLGDFKAGETKILDDQKQSIMVSAASIYEEKLLEDLAGGNPNTDKHDKRLARIYMAYQYFLENRMNAFTKEDCVLVGFTENETDADIFRDSDFMKDGISMIQLQGSADYTTNGETLIPNLDNYIKAEDTYYYDVYRYISGETMKFRIQFAKGDRIKSLIYSKELNREFKKDSWSGFYGTVKAYNYQTKQYDNLFTGGEERVITNLSPYLDEENSISLLLETKVEQSKEKSITIPILSAVKEAD